MTRIVLALTVFSCSVFGQQALMFSTRSGQTAPDGTRTVTFSGLRPAGQPVTGAPYSADQVSENSQTLSDGTHIKNVSRPVHMARDSQGRVRTELELFNGGMMGQQELPPVVEIYDPVAGVGYILEDSAKIAHRVTVEVRQPMRNLASGTMVGGGLGTGGAGVAASGAMKMPNEPERSVEKLDSQTIEGVVADGRRITNTWPIGSRGNDRPMVETSEFWTSPQLKLTVLSKTTSPRGDFSMRLTNLVAAEPDPMLFQPPAGYSIVDDKDNVTITVKPQPTANH